MTISTQSAAVTKLLTEINSGYKLPARDGLTVEQWLAACRQPCDLWMKLSMVLLFA